MNDAPNDAPIAGPNDPVPAPPIRDPVQIDANIVAAAAWEFFESRESLWSAAAKQFIQKRALRNKSSLFYSFTNFSSPKII